MRYLLAPTVVLFIETRLSTNYSHLGLRFGMSNITIIAEAPKMRPYIDVMRAK